jgi:hypothetical protein
MGLTLALKSSTSSGLSPKARSWEGFTPPWIGRPAEISVMLPEGPCMVIG